MSNSKPSSIHIFLFKLGMQLSQDAVFTNFWWNNSFTLRFITSPTFIDKAESFKCLKSPARWNKSLWRWPVLLLCTVCCFGDCGCPLVLGSLLCDVSAPWLSFSLPSSSSLQEIGNGRPQHLQPVLYYKNYYYILMWGYSSRDLMTFPFKPSKTPLLFYILHLYLCKGTLGQ